MATSLRERLASQQPLICDGAMGTMLQKAAPRPVLCPEELNVIAPEVVQGVHRAYAEAGADIITANSFGGNRRKLELGGLQDRLRELNIAAARLASTMAGGAMVAGDIGPLGAFMEPLGELSFEAATALFAEQGAALAEGGVDLFIVETMYDLAEVRAAVEGLRRIADLPIICSLTFDQGGRTMMGVAPEQAADAMAELGVEVFGTNCGSGPEESERAVKAMRAAQPSALLIAQPNAGLPQMEGGEAVYAVSPEQMAAVARRFVKEYGVKIVGSCCGSTPEYTRAIAQALGRP